MQDNSKDFEKKALGISAQIVAVVTSTVVESLEANSTPDQPIKLKPVAGRMVTLFQPRVSLLPHRTVNTGKVNLPNLTTELIPSRKDSDMPRSNWVDDSHPIRDEFIPENYDGLVHNSLPSSSIDIVNVKDSSADARAVGIVNRSLQEQPIFIGNVKLQTNSIDSIADAFLQSSPKTLHFVPPMKQNGEIIIRPSATIVEKGSKRWQATAWILLEGGPWLFQGQAIILQCWEPGMLLRRQKHKQLPVWIQLKHLPMEYWTEEGLSTVASGVGTPLYADKITRHCLRLNFARICVMLDYKSTLPKYLVVISPHLIDGKEIPTQVDVKYEWLPQRCKQCCSLGHIATACPDTKKKDNNPPVRIFVRKQQVNHDKAEMEADKEAEMSKDCKPSCQYEKPMPSILLRALTFAARDSVTHDKSRILECPRSQCEGIRSLWKRLDRILVNAAWLEAWPNSTYIWSLSSTSDHSPLILNVANGGNTHSLFRFDNFLAKQSGFLESVSNKWRHKITGTAMYGVVCKLKNLKAMFRQHRKLKGDLSDNVHLAKGFLDKAQELFAACRDDFLLMLVKCCRQVYSVAVKLEKIACFANVLITVAVVWRSKIPNYSSGKLMQEEQGREYSKLLQLTECAPGPDGYTPAFSEAAWPVVGEEFSANEFVPGRRIYDNILLAQELLTGYNHAKLPPRCTIKVDLKKAYDSVEWDFLNESSQRLQFQHHWKCKELNILNICFADDVLLFCKAHLPSATVIKDALSEFSILSGLNVNPAKSQIILSRAAQQNKQQLLEL
ncbi:hypothetical protein Sango_3034300 [Sesamum angolense]|uniref:DUF4283 domain-containing protein n=1 Tax=Sesamum angolense TaxID=2727404 RepID=A0AAE1T9H1_9LAMI|nr:hypothetical protein Sango_3034300 [Sesamum angolense]